MVGKDKNKRIHIMINSANKHKSEYIFTFVFREATET